MFQIRERTDAIIARQRGRDIASAIGFGLVDQTIIAYTISELALKLLQYPDKGHLVIRKLHHSKDESYSGIEVRLYDHYRGPVRLNPLWAEKFVDDLDLAYDSARGTTITFRKWLVPPLRIDSPSYAAGEE